jgi:uncharacterized membrane protein YsdA (DUF1294 family)
MRLTDGQWLLAGWLGATSALSFALFAYDKWQARRRGGRVSESTLWLISAFGGWPGGLLGILVFRHKSAKIQFQIKFTMAFLVWLGLLWAVWRLGRHSFVGRISPAGWNECSRSASISGINPHTAAQQLRFGRISLEHKRSCG